MTITIFLPWLLYDSTSAWYYSFLLCIGRISNQVINAMVLEDILVMILSVANNRNASQVRFIKMKFIRSQTFKIMG